MRVLFSAVGGLGHILPLVPLARAVVAAGHEVRWATSPDACGVVEQAGFAAVPSGMTMATRRDRLAQRMGEFAELAPDARTDLLVSWTFGELLPEVMLDNLLPVVDGWRPNLVVHDAMEFAAPIVARLAGVVHVTHSLGPLTPEARVVAIGQEVDRLWKRTGISRPAYAGLYDYLYLDIYPPSMRRPGGDYVEHRQSLRPTFDASNSPPLPPHRPELADRPLVYVSFGTEIPDERPLRAVIEGLAELPVRALVTVGTHRDPATFTPAPTNVIIERFVPQSAVMEHAALVISHGGSGTVLGALAAGLPQLCLPYFADQPINAHAVASSGAGIALDIASLEPSQITSAVSCLLTEDHYVQGARRISAEIDAMPDVKQIVRLITELAANPDEPHYTI